MQGAVSTNQIEGWTAAATTELECSVADSQVPARLPIATHQSGAEVAADRLAAQVEAAAKGQRQISAGWRKGWGAATAGQGHAERHCAEVRDGCRVPIDRQRLAQGRDGGVQQQACRAAHLQRQAGQGACRAAALQAEPAAAHP